MSLVESALHATTVRKAGWYFAAKCVCGREFNGHTEAEARDAAVRHEAGETLYTTCGSCGLRKFNDATLPWCSRTPKCQKQYEARNLKNRFSSNNQVAACRSCGKRTHSSIEGVAGVRLCRACNEDAELENEHSDGHHDDTPNPACRECR